MSMYNLFKTDQNLEKNGIIVDYGDFRVTLARAGGANRKFSRLLDARTKPHRRSIQTETMDKEKAEDIMREIYADTVILGWETKINGEFVSGIEDPTDKTKVIPYTRDNVVAVLRDLPDLFIDLQEQATKSALFREEILEADAKN